MFPSSVLRARAHHHTAHVAAILLALAVPLAAQQPLRTGNRVRVTAQERATDPRVPNATSTVTVVGDVVALNADTIVLSADGWRHAFPRASLLRIEVSRGRAHRSVRRGAIIGGAITGGLLSSVACAMAGSDCRLRNAPQMAVLFAIGAIPGALIGGVVADVWTTGERWEDVAMPYWAGLLMEVGTL